MLLAALFLLWLCLGSWVCLSAPFASGTDESIRYVAFAAAKNRWAAEADFKRYGIDNFYYPPLYFLLFAPFYPDEPSFTDASSWKDLGDPNYIENGGNYIVSRESRTPIPAQLGGLYRTAKFLSLACGAVVLACLAAALALLFDGPSRWWLVLGGTAPCLLLPQFLYYQTLCNNDALANALSALALLAFVGAWRAALGGRQGPFVILSLGSAASVGLGLLAKQSAASLAPLLPALALLPWLDRGRTHARGVLTRSLGLFCVLCVTAIACGGWWTLLTALRGDPTTAVSQRLTHPWALRESGSLDFDFAVSVALKLMRSYVALFTGDVVSIPDAVFLLYLAVPLVLTACLPLALIAAGRRPAPATAPDPRRRNFERLLWYALAATIMLNLGLIGLYNLSIRAPYGRLLFPTLVASHVLLARGLLVLARGRPRATAGIALGLTSYLFCLFLWVFSGRMVPAVTQPPEHLVPLAPYTRLRQLVLRPAWRFAVSQPLRLPPGALRGLRVKIVRSQIPQVGSVLSARLRLLDAAGRETASLAFEPSPVGDNDATFRWTDLMLPAPQILPAATAATLDIRASRSALFPDLPRIGYAVVRADRMSGLPPSSLNGIPSDDSLCLAAVYSVP